jgi:hypothetical protein
MQRDSSVTPAWDGPTVVDQYGGVAGGPLMSCAKKTMTAEMVV